MYVCIGKNKVSIGLSTVGLQASEAHLGMSSPWIKGIIVIHIHWIFFFWLVLDLNLGLQTCKAGALLLEPRLQSI
jgi:hypothetical protein